MMRSLQPAAIAAATVSSLTVAVTAQPTFRSGGVELVRLDVSVTRGGHPVRGLSARDFTILDNGAAALNPWPDDDSRSMVLAFTDGIDNASWLSTSQLLTAVGRLGVVVHAVSLGMPPLEMVPSFQILRSRPRQMSFLEALVDAAGGRQWSATSSRDLKELFTRAIDEMRARYLITFYPAGPAAEGWHELKVTASARGEVMTRPGYFVPPREDK